MFLRDVRGGTIVIFLHAPPRCRLIDVPRPRLALSAWGFFIVSTMNTPFTGPEHSPLEGQATLKASLCELISQSRHQLYILAYDLDPLIYSNDDFNQQLSALARRSKRPNIRLLLHNANRLLSHPHRVLPLLQRLSSLIEVRQLNEQYKNQWQSYIITDQPAMLYQATYERYDAIVGNDPRKIAEMRKQFEQMWQHSGIATTLRRQML